MPNIVNDQESTIGRVVSRILEIHRDEGFTGVFKRALRFSSDQFASMTGSFSLELAQSNVEYSAPTRRTVTRTRGRFESEFRELSSMVESIQSDDVVYDIGANVGLYTLFAAKACPSGEVIAFEPYPPNAELLKQDIKRNNLQNVSVIEVALSDTTGTTRFSVPEQSSFGIGTPSISTDASGNTIEIQMTTVDRLIDGGGDPATRHHQNRCRGGRGIGSGGYGIGAGIW